MTSAVWHAGLGFIKPIKIPIKMPGPLSGDGGLDDSSFAFHKFHSKDDVISMACRVGTHKTHKNTH
jgi:hypothetical protein